jgi:hypothetical protein
MAARGRTVATRAGHFSYQNQARVKEGSGPQRLDISEISTEYAVAQVWAME